MSSLAAVPIRWRLVIVMTAVMALVLAAACVVLYAHLGSSLDETIKDDLQGRAQEVAALARHSHSGLREAARDPLVEQHESFAQVIGLDGVVVDGTPVLGDRAALRGDDLRRASASPTWFQDVLLPGIDGPSRLLGTPTQHQGTRLVVVVGTSLEDRSQSMHRLLKWLLAGGLLALLLSALSAYLVGTVALRPVEAMRREAEAVSAFEPGRRLPLPAARDEIRRLGETLNTMLGRLEEALTRERRFVADASHELRTPLAALRCELELALRRRRSPRELEASVRSAAEEAERLSQLAEDLLVLARSHRGELPVHREQVEAAELLAGVRERFAARAAAASRPLEVDAEEHLSLSVDRLRMEQALGNLVENALRHGDGPVFVQARRRDGRVELHVRDAGPGLGTAFIAHAFEPFTRADPARSGGGAGLGLNIVAVVAHAHGGEAHAADLGPGADVWIELPDRSDRPATA